MLNAYIKNTQLVNKIATLTSDTDVDFSTSAEKADSLKTFFQSFFVKDNEVDYSLTDQITHTSCDDDGNNRLNRSSVPRNR